jgi:hypothetical protein
VTIAGRLGTAIGIGCQRDGEDGLQRSRGLLTCAIDSQICQPDLTALQPRG